MRVFALLLFCWLVSPLAAQDKPEIASNLAARHPAGKWKIRKADLYKYLARYNGGQPAARVVLKEYMKRRIVEAKGRELKITVTDAEVDRWLKSLDEKLRRSGQHEGLAGLRKQMGMRAEELRQRGRQWVIQEKIARRVANKNDPSRPKNRPVPEDMVITAVDKLFLDAPVVADPKKLKAGVVVRVGGIDITEYQFGRTLALELAATEVYRALLDLILFHETNLLVGNTNPPTEAELAEQKRWYMEFELNRLKRQVNQPDLVTEEVVIQRLRRRGLTLKRIYQNPAFKAQARARGYFLRKQNPEKLKEFFEANQAKYGERLRVQRLLIAARAQRVVAVGQKIRTLREGKAESDRLWMKLHQGEDFGKLARAHSDDPDAIRRNGGVVPFLITADFPGYQDAFQHAAQLKVGQITKPFFSGGRGYLIVKLLERETPKGYRALEDQVRADAADREYSLWRKKATVAAIKNRDLLGEYGRGRKKRSAR